MNLRRDVRIHDPSPSDHDNILTKLSHANEQTWLLIGRVAEQMNDHEHALSAYENALRHNPMSLAGLTQVAGIARIKENYPKAIEYFQRVLSLQEDNGEIWSALGHCYLMQDDLQKAYSAYQQALYLLPNPKEDPKLWYGIGILYDRYGSLDHAEEAFSSVLRMDKALGLDFDKSNEILFRLGIIYKQQGKYEESLNCFDRILRNPPNPLAHADIWFQIGHVYEQQKDYHRAKGAYERVVEENPNHAKVLQQLGWLYHQDGSSFQNQDLAIQYLTKSLEADPSDAQSWYLLGRAYMAGSKYNKAYEAYQQAVYRDGRNPTFWCSIGVLYFQINQYRDALDAYSRAIRINPYISEVWFDLGSLYESCNNQITDAIDAYARASELDPSNPAITQRLQLLKQAQAAGGQLPPAPGPQDVHPTAYASAVVPPPGLNGPLMLHGGHRNAMRADSRGPSNEISLPPAQLNGRASSPPFRGGPPPPVNIDESRHPSSTHPPLAPMEVDRPPAHPRDYPPPRDGPARGPSGHQSILLNHGPPPPGPPEDLRNGHPDPFYNRGRPPRSHSNSPAPHSARPRSPGQHGFNYPPPRQHVGPGQSTNGPPQRSPRMYTNEHGRAPMEVDGAWDRERRPPPPPLNDQRDWDRERDRRPRTSGDFPPPHPGQGMYPHHSPSLSHRPHSPPQPSPRSQPGRFWESKPATAPPSAHMQHRPSPPPPPGPSRYDPARYGTRGDREYEPSVVSDRGYPPSPETNRGSRPQSFAPTPRRSESPHPSQSVEAKTRRRVMRDPKELEIQPHPSQQQGAPVLIQHAQQQQQQVQQVPLQQQQQQLPPPPQSTTPIMQDPSGKKRRKNLSRRKEDGSETPKPEQQQARAGSFKYSNDQASTGSSSSSSERGFKGVQSPEMGGERYGGGKSSMQPPYGVPGPKSTGGPNSPPDDRQNLRHAGYPGSYKGSPEPGPPSSRSVLPSPTTAAPRAPVRPIDEDYDEGVGVDALMGLAQQPYRAVPTPQPERSAASPAISPRSRGQGAGATNGSTTEPSPRPPPSHRNSVSSTLSHTTSPGAQAAQLKRPRSPVSDESEHSKRSRTSDAPLPGPGRRRGSSISNGGQGQGQQGQGRDGGRMTPVQPGQSTRPSPIPFRTQPAVSHSPEARNVHVDGYAGEGRTGSGPAASPPPLGGVVLPPHPRPVGSGRGGAEMMGLPSIATLNGPGQSPGGSPRERTVSPPGSRGSHASAATTTRRDSAGSGGGRGVSRSPPVASPGSGGEKKD